MNSSLIFFRQYLSLFLIAGIILIPHQYSFLLAGAFLTLMLSWKYNDGKCVTQPEESDIYPFFKDSLTYESYESSVNLFITTMFVILVARYYYQIDIIEMTSSVQAVYFSIGFIICIGFFSSLFQHLAHERTPKQLQIALVQFVVFISIYIYIYYDWKSDEHNDAQFLGLHKRRENDEPYIEEFPVEHKVTFDLPYHEELSRVDVQPFQSVDTVGTDETFATADIVDAVNAVNAADAVDPVSPFVVESVSVEPLLEISSEIHSAPEIDQILSLIERKRS